MTIFAQDENSVNVLGMFSAQICIATKPTISPIYFGTKFDFLFSPIKILLDCNYCISYSSSSTTRLTSCRKAL